MDNLLNRFLLAIILVTSFAVFRASGQGTTAAKALKYFDKARENFEKGEWVACENDLKRAIQADSTFPGAYIMLGDVYQETGNLNAAAEQYRNALRFKPEREEIVQNLLANALFSQEKYSEACIHYRKVLEFKGISPDLKASIETKIGISEFRKTLMENTVAYDPMNLGQGVNTAADEYINAMAADGTGIYFTRRMKNKTDQPRDFIEDFYFAPFSGDSLVSASRLDYPPGKQDDAGAICISADGRMIFFTSCFRTDSYGSCDLYFSEKIGDEWTLARNMGPYVNSESWDAQPAVSPDGNTLYFTSSRPGGLGGADIWKTERGRDGNWKRPENMGSPVNTGGSEMAPFIHFDNQTLYFSSGGLPGMGGTDLFKSVNINGKWSVPENLGYPINSSADELVIIVNPEGNRGFISNNSLVGEGGYDIYRFGLHESIRPVPVTYLKGKVFDAENSQALEARFELIDIEKDSVISSASSDRLNGEFLVCLPCNRDYALNVSCNGYLFYSDHFPLAEIKSSTDPVIKDIPLEPVAIGNKIMLRNIFYETDQFRLMPGSYVELDKLFDFLKANPSLIVEIGGHTDDQGTAEYNLDLSLKRAGAVYDYLVERGSDPGKITFKGYGENNPLGSNDTEKGRALNRRTEITIIGSK